MPYDDVHFLREFTVKKIQGTLVPGVLHIVAVCCKGPVDGLGSKLNVGIPLKKRLDGPFGAYWPVLNASCEDEWLLGPLVRILLVCQVFKATDLVGLRDVGGEVREIHVAAGKRSMKDIREDVAAINQGPLLAWSRQTKGG
jgi:hypothetical protein